MLYGLDLFSGIGGISIALEPWVRTVAYCELNKYARATLLDRMEEGKICIAPIWNDIRTLKAKHLPEIDIIFGGFPCQDISSAGTRTGLEGKRSSLFFQIIRLVGELRPRFVFLENVPAITLRGLDRVLLEFTSLGYDCRWTIVSAAEVGAPHLRERWFLLAHAASVGRCQGRPESKRIQGESCASGGGDEVSHALRAGLSRGRSPRLGSCADAGLFAEFERCGRSWWTTEPNVGRVANGVPFRVDRIKGLGNAVVPLQARTAFEILSGLRNPDGSQRP